MLVHTKQNTVHVYKKICLNSQTPQQNLLPASAYQNDHQTKFPAELFFV